MNWVRLISTLLIYQESFATSDHTIEDRIFTGTAGRYVDLPETISAFQEILRGDCDDTPEAAFYMVGDLKEIHSSKRIRHSIVVSISPCHGDDRGSIPRVGTSFSKLISFDMSLCPCMTPRC